MEKVKITKYDEGPYVIEGNLELLDGKGHAFEASSTIALCRCTHSKSQPFCDGSHKVSGFKEASEAR